MDASIKAKIMLTILVGFVDFVYLSTYFIYRANKKEYDRRYWGKNHTWLMNNLHTNMAISIILVLFIIGIWLSK
jgi:hypothetical protein